MTFNQLFIAKTSVKDCMNKKKLSAMYVIFKLTTIEFLNDEKSF